MLSSNFIFIGINNSLQFKMLYKKFFHLTGQQNVIREPSSERKFNVCNKIMFDHLFLKQDLLT